MLAFLMYERIISVCRSSSGSISMMENKSLKSVQSSRGDAGPSQSASTSSRRPGVRLSAMHAAELICLVDDMLMMRYVN